MSKQSPKLLANLEDIQDQYRQQALEERLEDVADDLRDIKLQIAIMNELFGESPDVGEELTEKVHTARKAVAREAYDDLDDMIDDLEQTADSERASIEQSLTQQLVSNHQQVKAMTRLNEKLDAYPAGQLKALKILLDNWNWKEAVSIEDLSTFEEQIAECRAFGQEMREIYEDAQQEIIEPLAKEGIEDIVTQILDSEPVYLGNLSESKREDLAASELGDYLTISLG
jgi:hypothetical protein